MIPCDELRTKYGKCTRTSRSLQDLSLPQRKYRLWGYRYEFCSESSWWGRCTTLWLAADLASKRSCASYYHDVVLPRSCRVTSIDEVCISEDMVTVLAARSACLHGRWHTAFDSSGQFAPIHTNPLTGFSN